MTWTSFLGGYTLKEKEEPVKRKVKLSCRLCTTSVSRAGQIMWNHTKCEAGSTAYFPAPFPHPIATKGTLLIWLHQGTTCSANLPHHCHHTPNTIGDATWPLSSKFEDHCTTWFLKFPSVLASLILRLYKFNIFGGKKWVLFSSKC